MDDKLQNNLESFERFLQEKGWTIFESKNIEYGLQVMVTDGVTRLPVNFYRSGKIVVQGKPCEMKAAITEWVNLLLSGISSSATKTSSETHKNRIAKYFVIPENVDNICSIVMDLPGEVIVKETGGPAERYRVEVRGQGHRVTITQYASGTLIVQGLSSPHFETIYETLNKHLTQSFAERASSFVTGETERATVAAYLDKPEAENEATTWLYGQIGESVLHFLFENDQRTLLAAAGVRNAFRKTDRNLPDYSVVVMPFAKPFEGFLMRLAIYLGLTSEEALKQKANEIEIGGWLETIKTRSPDAKRYGEIQTALDAAWGSRNKAMHSDAFHPLGILKSFVEAEQEIATILRAMKRAYRVFIEEEISLLPYSTFPEDKSVKASEAVDDYKFEGVDRDRLNQQLQRDGFSPIVHPEEKKIVWEIKDEPDLSVKALRGRKGLVIVRGNKAEEFCQRYNVFLLNETPNHLADIKARIGVDESGKGDLFGPLVIAGVLVTPDTEFMLARQGVRDSKSISDSVIQDLALVIRDNCPHEILVLLPPEYNAAYDQHGRNLNRLLAWGHAQVISHISKRENVQRAISDQFGDENLIIEALKAEGCEIALEQRPRAESDVAVASASVLARDAFIQSMQDYADKAGFEIPLGASATQVKQIGKDIYRRWGQRGLERIAKMHFKTIQEIINEVEK